MKKYFSILTFVGLVLGVLFGIFFKEYVSSVAFLGQYYVSILKYFITPVIFTSISYTIYKTSKNKSRLVGKSIVTFIIMYIATFLLTSLLVWIIDPSKGFVFETVEWANKTAEFDILTMLKNLIPRSLSDIFVNPKVFTIILIAYLFGKIASLFKADKVFDVIDKVKKVLFKALEIFMYLTPIAVFSLISEMISKNKEILLGVGLKYILCALGCGLVTLVVVMMLPCKYIANIDGKDYIKKAHKVWLMTITTRSSSATLPYTVKTCKEEFNIPSEVTDVVVPLGCTIHMCGGAVSFALLGLFTAGLYGIEISFATYLIMILASLLINMAAPGIPNGGIVIGASFIEMLGIPLGFIGFYSGIYPFLDMIYTTLNVTGDITANICINKLLKEKKND